MVVLLMTSLRCTCWLCRRRDPEHPPPYAHADDAQLVPNLLPSPVPRSCARWGAGGGAHVAPHRSSQGAEGTTKSKTAMMMSPPNDLPS